ncbi:MAG: condensation domain-containing protein, partial [Oscillospiraceae bacterium]|nr:condensation domain-containing protein [Oscillospiraceae bacterium]
MMYKVDDRLSAAQIEEILSSIYAHHDMLRAHVENDAIVVVPVSDFHCPMKESDLSPIADKSSVRSAIQSESDRLQASIDLYHGPLVKTQLFHTCYGQYLNIVVHHLSIDGVSWRILSEDLNSAASCLLKGLPIRLTAKTHGYNDYAESLSRYRESYRLSQEKAYWTGVRSRMEQYEYSRDDDGNRSFGTVESSLDSSYTHRLLTESGKAYNTEINDLLVAALGRAYHSQTGKSGLNLQMEGHGRENFDENLLIDRTVGWFTCIYPLVLENLGGDERRSIRAAKETLHRVPDKGFGYGQLFGMDVEKVPLISFNYLGEFQETKDDSQPFSINYEMPSGRIWSERNRIAEDIVFNGSVKDG